MSLYRLRKSDVPLEKDAPFSVRPLIQNLLRDRGITKDEDAMSFIKPDYVRDTHSPQLLKDMEKATARFVSAIKGNERVAIYSDYDHDGIPGAVIFNDFFTKIGFANYEIYIPHRNAEGFGLNVEAIDELNERGAKVIVSVDCGINDLEEALHAKKLAIDLIVTDHHQAVRGIPEAYAVVNPNQDGCEYPNKFLCGAGVAFKFLQAVMELGAWNIQRGWEKWMLDMVAIATLSDMVPLVGENRVLAYYGLMVLRQSRRPGVRALLKKIGVRQSDITEDDVGFSISPRINAASRMGIPMDAYKLLSVTDQNEAERLVAHLEAINAVRKGIVASMVKEIHEVIRVRYKEGCIGRVIVAGNPAWKPSLLGLAANTIMEHYGSPVFLWGREGGTKLKGSCRARGVDVLTLMKDSPSLLEYGGHTMSGGFTIAPAEAHLLEDSLQRSYEALGVGKKQEARLVDDILPVEEVGREIHRELSALAPFGVGNPKPLFIFPAALVADVTSFGKEKNHLKIVLRASDSRTVNAVGFFMKREQFGVTLEKGLRINIVGTIERSTFGGREELRIRIIDIISNESYA
ncbi:MAG: single-stranded-DNA-specific exonuclease RecJ [Candidatus Taylorbacteria bacterium RIFCSPLOWO2_01_FULL_45_15b]|uniref:Single-stranded-DNA-specific exonuclease RecJ n=1 Tax=Candidatus Taylorbacteria bacterium RIFCSPLOWO2_01_FULL_45_15b TaxID=1802319 RepID=A0A1G2N7M7_9BACT|nr:MAG: single-stranded-DNA-specific exonuclease RecJ [Candidatus Taylorbacteria bacterium RIFCSPLOWO2_01_FULL_45_15b]